MAVAFTDREKQDIAKVLVDTAEELFATQGLKKTSLEELVGPARIAKGSFYAFFDSKEALYLEVMLRRAPQIATRFTGMLERPVDEEGLVALMHAIADVLVADPFYRRLLSHPDELDTVTRRVGREQIARISPHLLTPLVEYLAAGQRDGAVVDDIAPEVLVDVIRAAGLIVMHRDRFATDYRQVLDATIRFLSRGMLR
ncbi:TetR/AcrR family transcriptional regulator [Mycolicibacterium sp. 624]|uniref:TetR/AcrR family transcriptional regulator n=1 Tax=Mycolicibacterium sp. 624 TaxID=3156314 RepID=UPI00339B7581